MRKYYSCPDETCGEITIGIIVITWDHSVFGNLFIKKKSYKVNHFDEKGHHPYSTRV